MRPGAEKGFLFKIALNLAAHARRTLARRREVLAEEAPERNETFPTPEQLTDQKRMRQMLDGVLDRMDESLRVVFVLYEFEEMNMSEIADVLENTTWDGRVSVTPGPGGVSRARRRDRGRRAGSKA